jgi:hypothetical protein
MGCQFGFAERCGHSLPCLRSFFEKEGAGPAEANAQARRADGGEAWQHASSISSITSCVLPGPETEGARLDWAFAWASSALTFWPQKSCQPFYDISSEASACRGGCAGTEKDGPLPEYGSGFRITSEICELPLGWQMNFSFAKPTSVGNTKAMADDGSGAAVFRGRAVPIATAETHHGWSTLETPELTDSI